MRLIAGTSLVDEAPLAALAARQCARAGGRVFVLNAGEAYLNDVAQVAPTPPARLGEERAPCAPNFDWLIGTQKARHRHDQGRLPIYRFQKIMCLT